MILRVWKVGYKLWIHSFIVEREGALPKFGTKRRTNSTT